MTATNKRIRREIRLTPAQAYLYNAYKALESGDEAAALGALLKRPETLKSAISAAFYKSVGVNLSSCL